MVITSLEIATGLRNETLGQVRQRCGRGTGAEEGALGVRAGLQRRDFERDEE